MTANDKQYGSGTPGNQGTQSGVGAQPGGGGAGLGANATGMSDSDEQYWRSSYQSEAYYNNQYGYDDYEPAYRMGTQAQASGRYSGQSWEQARSSMQQDWESSRGNSRLGWQNAEPAARAAYARSQSSGSGDRNTASGSSTADLSKPGSQGRSS